MSKQPKTRFKNHLSFSFKVPNKSWIDSLKAIGKTPVLDVVLGPMAKDQAERAESRLMRLHQIARPGSLLQRTPAAGGKTMLRRFGMDDIRPNTPFLRFDDVSLGLLPEEARS
jgi:hypothetical protein